MKVYALSPISKAVVQTAQSAATERSHNEVDSSHLLYALATRTEAVEDWLGGMHDFDVHSLVPELEQKLSQWHKPVGGYPEPTSRYLNVMHRAQQTATQGRAEAIGPVHLLEAILAVDDRVIEWLSQKEIALGSVKVPQSTPLLDLLGRDLTALASQGKLDPVFGREAELEQIVEVLLRKGKNSVLLLGPPGVGKTAIVERLAQSIAAGDVPTKLLDTRLIEVSVTALIAGTSYRGQFEERLRGLLQELDSSQSDILVIDEFHSIMGVGKTINGGTNAADILKPALARGDVTCIGITTRQEYTRCVEEDGALERRLQPIDIGEPSPDDTLRILQRLAPEYEDYHNIEIDFPALEAIVKLAKDHMIGRRFPDKAIDVLGKTCSRAELRGLPVSVELVTEVIGDVLGVPLGQLHGAWGDKLANLEKELAHRVKGQDQAIAILSRAIRVAYAGLRDPRRPTGVFLLVGPTGVGKTEMARALACILWGTQNRLIRLDMSEYSERIDVSRLIGAAPGYIGHDEPGQLTQALRDQPHSLVLLDEIEKAHLEVLNLLLQLFDEGRLTDSHGRRADGRHALFIMTSNLGAEERTFSLGFARGNVEVDSNEIAGAVRDFFLPELLNRIDNIVVFRRLQVQDLVEIATLQMEQLSQRLAEHGISLTYEATVLQSIAEEALKEGGGGRSVIRLVASTISTPISDTVIELQGATARLPSRLHVRVAENAISVNQV